MRIEIKGVMHGPCRVMRRDIQRLEVVKVVLDLGALGHFGSASAVLGRGVLRRLLHLLLPAGRLRAVHRGPLSHAVEKQVRAWGHYYGDAAVQTVTLIQIKDSETLNELLAEPEVRAILRPFVPDPAQALALLDAARRDYWRREVETLKQGLDLAEYAMAGRDTVYYVRALQAPSPAINAPKLSRSM